MKKNISPVVAAIVIVLVIAVGALLLYSRTNSSPQYGAPVPEVVAKDAREHGPRPMPPIPMPGGGQMTPQGGATGPQPTTR